jgi:hypothetical protein
LERIHACLQRKTKNNGSNAAPQTLAGVETVKEPTILDADPPKSKSDTMDAPRFKPLVKKGPHVYGMRQEYLEKFSGWLRYMDDKDQVYCHLCKKHIQLLEKQAKLGKATSTETSYAVEIP